MAATVRALVNGAWLAERLTLAKTAVKPTLGAQVRLLDTSWYLEKSGRDGRTEFRHHHIPGAWFFDLDAASSPDSEFDHTVPSAGHFSQYVSQLGVRTVAPCVQHQVQTHCLVGRAADAVPPVC